MLGPYGGYYIYLEKSRPASSAYGKPKKIMVFSRSTLVSKMLSIRISCEELKSMKSPLVVGLASIVPGLGLLIVGKHKQALLSKPQRKESARHGWFCAIIDSVGVVTGTGKPANPGKSAVR